MLSVCHTYGHFSADPLFCSSCRRESPNIQRGASSQSSFFGTKQYCTLSAKIVYNYRHLQVISYFSLTLKLPAQDDGRVWDQVEQLQHHGIQSLLGGEQDLLQGPTFRELLTFLRSAQLEILRFNTEAPPGAHHQGAPHHPQVSSVRDLTL